MMETCGPFSEDTTMDEILSALSTLNIAMARLYDVNLALLHLTDRTTAVNVENTHAEGKFVGPPPLLDDNPFG